MATGFQKSKFNLNRLKKQYTPAQIKIITAAKIESTDFTDGRTDRRCWLYDSREPLSETTGHVPRHLVEKMWNDGLLYCRGGTTIGGVDCMTVTWFPKCQRCEDPVDDEPQLIGGKFYCLECTCRDCGEILMDGEFDTCNQCIEDAEAEQED